MTHDDPRAQPGAYVQLNGRLYYVEEFKQDSTATGRLWVTNCATEYHTWISVSETERCQLVREAPTLDLDEIPIFQEAA